MRKISKSDGTKRSSENKAQNSWIGGPRLTPISPFHLYPSESPGSCEDYLFHLVWGKGEGVPCSVVLAWNLIKCANLVVIKSGHGLGPQVLKRLKSYAKKHGEPWDKKVYEGITKRTLANYAIKDLFLSQTLWWLVTIMGLVHLYDQQFPSFSG